ncbi:MAG: nucleotidyltransferase family protein [Bacteroidia bacterium]|nr:nucleotidyltransferase family protein [Bacteroidia bacterium]
MISAILLAAGMSRRMGAENKLLLPFRGKPLVAHIIEEILASQPGEIIVVTGHEAEEINFLLKDKPVKIVYNEKYSEGMTTSIQAGVRNANETSEGYMICLSDQPLITAAEYRLIVDAFLREKRTDEKTIQVPIFEGKRGNPVIFSFVYRAIILEHKRMEGCREIISGNPSHVHYLSVENSHILTDIDTPEDYGKL